MKSVQILLVATFTTLLILPVSFGQGLRFTNPIHGRVTNPNLFPLVYVFRLGSDYYLSGKERNDESNPNSLILWKSKILTDFRDAHKVNIYTTSSSAYSGQIHEINGELYLFLYGGINSVAGIYAIKAKNSSDPLGEWEEPVLVFREGSVVSQITVMKHGFRNYFIITKSISEDVLIAEMITPTQVSNRLVVIKTAAEPWECFELGGHICENLYPACVYNNNVTNLILSAPNGKYLNFQLVQMSISFGLDPLNPDNWKQSEGPVFIGDEDEGVYWPGAATFVDSPDKSETWMVYLASERPDDFWDTRTPRLEKITWNADGTPRFPKAHGRYHSLPVPRGQRQTIDKDFCSQCYDVCKSQQFLKTLSGDK